MHMKAKRPIFVPREHWAEIEKLSKAALMDLVWDYACRCVIDSTNTDEVMAELTRSAELILLYRKQEQP